MKEGSIVNCKNFWRSPTVINWVIHLQLNAVAQKAQNQNNNVVLEISMNLHAQLSCTSCPQKSWLNAFSGILQQILVPVACSNMLVGENNITNIIKQW